MIAPIKSVSLLAASLLLLSACSDPAPQTGPPWVCVAQESAEESDTCRVQVQGETLLVRLVQNKDDYLMLVSHADQGQVKTKLSITPKRGDPIEIEVRSSNNECNRAYCIIPIKKEQFATLKKTGEFEVLLTRAIIRPHKIKHQEFSESFTTRDLKKAMAEAGF